MADAARSGDFRKVLHIQRRLVGELAAQVRDTGDPAPAFSRITEIAAEVLAAGRVGLWLFDDDKTKITCLDLFIERDGRHISRNVVQRDDAPRYFDAVLSGEVVAAEDAYTDPRTCEFGAGYLPAFGVGALLDVPILAKRDFVGVMCVEHVGGARRWVASDRLLASSLAECTGLVIALQRGAGSGRFRRIG